MLRNLPGLICGLALVLTGFNVQKGLAQTIPLTAGMKIRKSTTLKPGNYRFADPGEGIVQISGSGFTVDFKGTKLSGKNKKGVGLHITDARNVTIKNADVSDCLWGIVIERSEGVKLIDCISSRNNDLPPGTVIDESGREPEDQWGGGVLLRDSKKCLVQRCKAQYQWDGIDVIRSAENTIEDGDFSYSGNWGVHFWDSSKNIFRRNRAVWCTTGAGTLFQALTGWQTYDSQAVGIDHNSNENLIEANDLRFGGDAIFIRANEGPITPGTVVPPKNGSHRNILRNNDCSFSPNNAIEVDLVDDTIIEGNNCSYSNYGMWLGYSRRCIVRNNLCINDSTHAVEIENGQDDVFENNIFGYDTPRPDGQLIYLRQNGRDKTPSQGYRFVHNFFYGARRGLQLKDTQIELSRNRMLWTGNEMPVMANSIGTSHFQEDRTDYLRTPLPVRADSAKPLLLTPGAWVRVPGLAAAKEVLTFVTVDGIPVWQGVNRGKDTFWMPADFWDRPAKETVTIRHFAEDRIVTLVGKIRWPEGRPRIDSVSPNPAKIGDTITLTGANLDGGKLLFNNKPATILKATPERVEMQLPEGILMPSRYNILWEKGTGAERVHTWPLTFTVNVPNEQRPHLLSAEFSPKTLKVGELLKVTLTVRNNLPTPAPLLMTPKPPYTYAEQEAFWEKGFSEQPPGTLHLRVTSERPGAHDSGSWPWLFGFDKPTLAPGETVTVTGYIRVQTPGEIEYRVGLVATGSRFIDDNAFRTKITVQP